MQLVCHVCGTRNRVPDERLQQGPSCGRCGAPLMETVPFPLDDLVFNGFIAGTQLPVLVDYWADWCAPCRMMAPQFEAAARLMPLVRFAKVDTEASPEASVRHRIRSIPTMVLFHRGEEVARRTGAMAASEIVKWVDAQLRATA